MVDYQTLVVEAFRKMRKEISRDASEYDVRHRFLKFIVEGLLGYSGKDYQAEKNKTDIRIFDENKALAVVIETKKPKDVNLNEEKWKDQAFGYSDAFTRYIVLTNGMHVIGWSKGQKSKPIIDLDFDAILTTKRLGDYTIEEKAQIQALWKLSKEDVWLNLATSAFWEGNLGVNLNLQPPQLIRKKPAEAELSDAHSGVHYFIELPCISLISLPTIFGQP